MAFVVYDPSIHSESRRLLRLIVMELLLGQELPIVWAEDNKALEELMRRLEEMVMEASWGYLRIASQQRETMMWVWVEKAVDPATNKRRVIDIGAKLNSRKK